MVECVRDRDVDAPNPPVSTESPKPLSDYSSEGDSFSDSVHSDQNGQPVPRDKVVECPCDFSGVCICNNNGGCVQGDFTSLDDCCNCSRRAHYVTGLRDDGEKSTDNTYCEVCDCKKCSSCWSQPQPENINHPNNSNNSSNNDSNSSDRNR